MSLSSFHDHFRGAAAMTPLQYQKQCGCKKRGRLCWRTGSTRQKGFRVGYYSPSQFSREYRRLFGAWRATSAFDRPLASR